VRGKERIVIECAIARPLASTRQDDFVGRLLWALSYPGALPIWPRAIAGLAGAL
jgi:hypothetical protein